MFSGSIINQQRTLIKKFRDGAYWFNLYSDGWVEQGCHTLATPDYWTFNFLIPFAEANNYSVYGDFYLTDQGANLGTTVRNKEYAQGNHAHGRTLTGFICAFGYADLSEIGEI